MKQVILILVAMVVTSFAQIDFQVKANWDQQNPDASSYGIFGVLDDSTAIKMATGVMDTVIAYKGKQNSTLFLYLNDDDVVYISLEDWGNDFFNGQVMEVTVDINIKVLSPGTIAARKE